MDFVGVEGLLPPAPMLDPLLIVQTIRLMTEDGKMVWV